jgi:hypothetical protein
MRAVGEKEKNMDDENEEMSLKRVVSSGANERSDRQAYVRHQLLSQPILNISLLSSLMLIA